MRLCDAGHGEVCYEDADCPVCAMESDKDDEIDELKKEVAKLKNEIIDLDRQLEAYR